MKVFFSNDFQNRSRGEGGGAGHFGWLTILYNLQCIYETYLLKNMWLDGTLEKKDH